MKSINKNYQIFKIILISFRFELNFCKIQKKYYDKKKMNYFETFYILKSKIFICKQM